jgi:tungstate transport system substrate-binding protein
MSAYTLSDRGTWLSFKNKGPLKIVVEGDPALINRYDVIELNPKTHAGAKLAHAHSLALWLTTQPGQDAIAAYRIGGEELFHPSAANPK